MDPDEELCLCFHVSLRKIRTFLELFPFARKDMFKRQKSYLKTERLR